ncbi:MAG: radical SAM protein [Gammaproteobacteria bacterium]|nr:radical SAM protein [Gammaproteobacteria bacterium]
MSKNKTEEVIAYELHGNCYLNLTSRCNLSCRFCPKFNGEWSVQGYPLRLYKEPEADEVIKAMGDLTQYKEVVFCGLGEPTRRLDVLLEVARYVRERGVRVRVNTDGLASWFHGRDVSKELGACVDVLSISLNAQDEAVYSQHCRPPDAAGLADVLDFIEKASCYIDDISISAIDGLSGVDVQACEAIATRLGVRFKRRVLDEVG